MAFSPDILNSVVQGGTALLNTAANFGLSAYNNAQQYKYAKKMWDESNAYNTPSAQMERLQSAGINPHIISGQSAVSPQNLSMSASDVPFVDLTNAAQFVLSQVLANKVADSNISKNSAEIDNIQANTDLTKSKKVAQDYTNLNILPHNASKLQREVMRIDQEIAMNNTRADLLVSQLKVAQAEAKFADMFYKNRSDKVKFDALIRGKEYDDYENMNIRPSDPWYVRQVAPVFDSLMTAIINKISPKSDKKKPWYKRIFN